MSIETWKKEFYPIPAEEAAEKSWEEAVQHSLQKWRGLQPPALEAHKLTLRTGTGQSRLLQEGDDTEFSLTARSCALCAKSSVGAENDDTIFGNEIDCRACPLAKQLGHPCDTGMADAADWPDIDVDDLGPGPWNLFVTTRIPLPMIEALEGSLSIAKRMDAREKAKNGC